MCLKVQNTLRIDQILKAEKEGEKVTFSENRDFGAQKKGFFSSIFFGISRFVATRGRILMLCSSKMQKIVDTREKKAKQNWFFRKNRKKFLE